MGKSEKKRGSKGSQGLIVPNDPASISYVRGIVARGEAAKADAQGNLPFGKTHEIVGETVDGLPILKRIRINLISPNHEWLNSGSQPSRFLPSLDDVLGWLGRLHSPMAGWLSHDSAAIAQDAGPVLT